MSCNLNLILSWLVSYQKTTKQVLIQRNSNEFSFNNESSSSNADMKTDSKVSDFTIESGYFYNSQGEIVTERELGPETAITKADSIYVDDETDNHEYSEKDQDQFKYEGQNYFMFDQRFSNASLENNKADSTFDDEGDFTPYERLSPAEEPPYDTLDRKDLFYTSPYEGEDTYDRLNFSGQFYPSEDKLDDELDYEQYEQLDRAAAEYDHLQTEEEFYKLVGDSDEQLANVYQPDGSEVVTENVSEGKGEEVNGNTLSQFAKAVLEKSLTLKKRRSQQTESNSASESGSNLSLKNSESDKKGESQTSDLGTDISSTYETDNTTQQALLNTLLSPTRELDNISTSDIPWENQLRENEYSYLLDPPINETELANPLNTISNTQFDLCTIRNESPETTMRYSNSTPLDEFNPQHWKRMLKKVEREKPSKPDETYQFVSRQLPSESKSCESISTQNTTSLPLSDNRITYTLQDEHTIAGRIPSIYNEELSPDYEDHSAYWKDHYNASRSGTKKSISDSELSKLTAGKDKITSQLEIATPPKPNYSTFPGDLPQGGAERVSLTFEPYLDFTPNPLDDIRGDSFEYSPGIPSPPVSQVLMPPPVGFASTDPEMLPPPPDIEKSFEQDHYLPPPPSNLELHTMHTQATLDDVTPPDEILYRMDLKHSRQFKKPGEWSTDEVGEWLESFGMEMYQSAFIDNDIQGSHLGLLDKEDLSALGITKLGHKMTIIKEISKLHF